MDPFESAEYRRSRAAYNIQCAVEYFVMLLLSDAYLATLLAKLGISDALNGIISSFISLAFFFQLLSVFLVPHISNVKRTSIGFAAVFNLMFAVLYLTPFFHLGTAGTVFVVCLCIILGYAVNYVAAPIVFQWGNSFVHPGKRGSFSSQREIISLISGMIFSAVTGAVVDRYTGEGKSDAGFLFLAVTIFVLTVCNVASLGMIKNLPVKEPDAEPIPIKEVLAHTVGSSSYRNIVVLTVLWNVAQYMTVGFMGIYKTKDLMLSVGAVQLINIVGNLFRCLFSKIFGRYADRNGFAKEIRSALVIAAAAFAVNIFSAPENRWCVVAFTVLYSVSQAGITQNLKNITYSYVEKKYFVQATAVKNCIGGICGFAASIFAGKILDRVQNSGWSFANMPVYGQQVLSAISLAVVVAAAGFTRLVIEKQSIMIQ